MTPDSIEWVQFSDGDTGKTYYWNRGSNLTVWQPPAGLEVVWVGAQDGGGREGSTAGTSAPMSVRMPSLRCLLVDARGRSEGLGIPSPHLGCHCWSPSYLAVMFGVIVLLEVHSLMSQWTLYIRGLRRSCFRIQHNVSSLGYMLCVKFFVKVDLRSWSRDFTALAGVSTLQVFSAALCL